MALLTDPIYLAGPMSGRPALNHPAFHAAARFTRALGRTVVNPAEFCLPEETPWADCMRVAVRAVSYCSEMLMLPGWETSKGAVKEAELAATLGIVVSELTFDAMADALLPDQGRLPLALVADTITTIMQSQLVAGQEVKLDCHSIFPVEEDGVIWGTNPYGQDFGLAFEDGQARLGSCLRDFVIETLQGSIAGMCPPAEAAALKKYRRAALGLDSANR